MSYSTPHHVRDYAIGACLAINHAFCLQAARRTAEEKRDILASTREIDLCARLGSYFGSSSRLHAQGSDGADLQTDSPPFQIEVKYLFPKRTNWAELSKDWRWLRDLDNNGGIFGRRALVWFWPSAELYRFADCLSVTRECGECYSQAQLTPLWPYTLISTYASSNGQKLDFAEPIHQGPHIIQIPNGRRFRIDLTGSIYHPVWSAVITRITPNEVARFRDEDIIVLESGAAAVEGAQA